MNTEVKNEKIGTMDWYAIKVQNNKERSVLEKLINEVKFSGWENKLGRTIIPTEKVYSVKEGKKTLREKIVYAGYIFVETSSKGELASILKTINGASGFVRSRSGEIHPMKEFEVKKILVDQEVTDTKDYTSIFVTEEEVEITDGPFETFRGKIANIDNEKEKVRVQVSIFGRLTNVDLNLSQIKKI